MVKEKPRRQVSQLITAQMHEGLSKRLQDPQAAFLGYWDAVDWVEQTYGVRLNYHTLRYHMRKHFKNKVKRGRKVLINKDVEAQRAFLKTL